MKKIKIIMLATSLFSCISIANAAWWWSSNTDSSNTDSSNTDSSNTETTQMKQTGTLSAGDSFDLSTLNLFKFVETTRAISNDFENYKERSAYTIKVLQEKYNIPDHVLDEINKAWDAKFLEKSNEISNPMDNISYVDTKENKTYSLKLVNNDIKLEPGARLMFNLTVKDNTNENTETITNDNAKITLPDNELDINLTFISEESDIITITCHIEKEKSGQYQFSITEIEKESL